MFAARSRQPLPAPLLFSHLDPSGRRLPVAIPYALFAARSH
jgi:hypothetical protein